MTEELEQKLFAKYPKIFVDKDKSMNETCMCWGISTGDGWYWLLDKLCSSIQWRIDNPPHDKNGPMPIDQVVAEQVKEKFGGLRFYYRGGDEAIHGKVGLAESMSNGICEECGSTKNIGHTLGWISTLCEDCKDKNKNKWFKDE